MGNACGGVCCTNEGNVEIAGQVENGRNYKNGYASQYSSNPNSGILKQQRKLTYKKIMEMPEDSKERK